MGLDPPLLWLWCRPAAAAQIQPLTWELPYAAGAALREKQTNKKVRSAYGTHDLERFSEKSSFILLNLVSLSSNLGLGCNTILS